MFKFIKNLIKYDSDYYDYNGNLKSIVKVILGHKLNSIDENIDNKEYDRAFKELSSLLTELRYEYSVIVKLCSVIAILYKKLDSMEKRIEELERRNKDE